MDKIYNPKCIEQLLYNNWIQQGYFKPNGDTQKESYCIMIPPPNVTGDLHMGHAFQQTIIDTMIRYQRMQGKNTLWQTGTDHAGIATQMIVERKIAIEKGKTRFDYGRDAFVDKIWQWKKQSSSRITYQMHRLGNSIDWERERFTMDTGLSNAVKEVFICLYQENLIYRGKRLVNWDPKLCTAISDLEVENRELKHYMWYLRYPLANGVLTTDGLDHLVIATTRPETMLGDTAVAVNPEDSRYCNLIGQFILLPFVKRLIPIVGDKHADMTKGTGCVKITPAHDFNDYEVGKRHCLPMINIMTLDGNIRQEAEVFDTNGKISTVLSKEIPLIFQGLERFTARRTIVAECNRVGLLVTVKPHNLIVPHGDRSGVIIEPILTDQWYMRIAPLAKIAVEVVEQGEIQFIPKQYKNMYLSWMSNIQDWCISRQLWWGHRIPAWYDIKGQVYVGHCEMKVRQQYQLGDDVVLHQDNDVLDTWFSSALWTFSTLGWPEDTEELRTFHPTNVVVSAFDIIFFWIARMIMLTTHFIKDKTGKSQIPFKTIYITGLIRNEEGQKMSKSKGNAIDPLDIIDGISLDDLLKKRTDHIMQPKLAQRIYKSTEKQFPSGIKPYGTDALRFTLISLASSSRNINWDMKRLDGYRNFCNKLWNASRFVLMNTEDQDCGFHDSKKILSLADRWILAEFNHTIKVFREALDNYRFDLAASILYEFIWNKFCDWYLELTKPLIKNGNTAILCGTRHTLVTVLESLLRLAHPLIPFITETIWQRVKVLTGSQEKTIMLQPFPIYNKALEDTNAIIDLQWIKQVIIAVRTIRAEMNIISRQPLKVLLRTHSFEVERRINENLCFILNLAQLDCITIIPINAKIPPSISKLIEGDELLIPITGLIDKDVQLARLTKEITCMNNKINRIINKLSTKDFIDHAPDTIVIKEHDKLEKYQKIKVKLLDQKALIKSL